MKKWLCLLMMTVLLAGCGAEETFETISDEPDLPAMAQPGIICVDLPGEDPLPVLENDSGRIYLCEDYEILLQTLEGGDLEQTMQTLSGRSREELMVLQTMSGDLGRYDFVWAAAGEEGDRLGRGVILDDGGYHYCMSALWDPDSTEKSQFSWDQVFSSFCLG